MSSPNSASFSSDGPRSSRKVIFSTAWRRTAKFAPNGTIPCGNNPSGYGFSNLPKKPVFQGWFLNQSGVSEGKVGRIGPQKSAASGKRIATRTNSEIQVD